MGALDTALEWLRQHPTHHLFPCKGKSQPLLTDYLKTSSNDPARIRQWHAYWTKQLGEEPWWGLAPELSKIVPVDVDTKPGKQGQETYDGLELAYGWPATFAVATPSGGFHLWYEGPHIYALGSPKSNHRDIDFAQFIIIPGCGAYTPLNTRPIVPAPAWLYIVAEKPDRSEAEPQEPVAELDTKDAETDAIHYLIHDAKPSVQYQGGEKALFDTACWLKDHGISFNNACLLLQKHYNVEWDIDRSGYCDPIWNYDHGPDADQLVIKVRNAYAYAHEKAPGADTPESHFANDPPEPLSDADKKAAEKAVKSAEKEKKRKSAFKDHCEAWVWVAAIDRFISRAEPERIWKTDTFDKKFAEDCPAKIPRISKAMFERPAFSDHKLDRPVFRPGHPEFPSGRREYNLYRPSEIVAAEGDTTLWNAHLAYLFPDKEDRDHVLNWVAWFIQHIGLKPKHVLLIAGRIQGTGKSFIAEALSEIIGRKNVAPITGKELSSPFNKWAVGSLLLLIEELRSIDRKEVANHLHPIITQETIPINNKNQETYSIDNCFGILAMTNEDAAIPMDNTDRRYLVVRTEAVPKDEAYYKTLYALLKDPAAIGAIAWELMHRDVGAYNGQAKAPFTKAKADMIEAGLSDLEHWMVEHSKEAPLNRRVICIDDVIEVLPARMHKTPRLSNAVASILRARFAAEKQGQQRVGGEYRSLWSLSGFTPWGEAGSAGKVYLKDRADTPHPAAKDFAEDG